MNDIKRVKSSLSKINVTFNLTFCEGAKQNFNKQKLFYLRDFRGTLTTRRANKMQVTTADASSLHFQALITIQTLYLTILQLSIRFLSSLVTKHLLIFTVLFPKLDDIMKGCITICPIIITKCNIFSLVHRNISFGVE